MERQEREPTIAEKLLAMSTEIATGKKMKFHQPADAGLFLEGIFGAGRGMMLVQQIEQRLQPGQEHRVPCKGLCDLTISKAADGAMSYSVEPWEGKSDQLVAELRDAAQPGRSLTREIEHDRGLER